MCCAFAPNHKILSVGSFDPGEKADQILKRKCALDLAQRPTFDFIGFPPVHHWEWQLNLILPLHKRPLLNVAVASKNFPHKATFYVFCSLSKCPRAPGPY